MSKWMLVVLLGLEAHFAASYLVPLDEVSRKEFGGLNVDQAKRLKQLEDENGRLKKLVADLSLEKQVLRDIAQGKL